jgi:hypothetical protein
MSTTLTGLFFGLGFGAWVYYKMMRQTGGNTKTSLLLAAAAGAVGFLVIFTLLGIILKSD